MATSKINCANDVTNVSTGVTGLEAVKSGNVAMVISSSTDQVTASANDTVWTLPSNLRPKATVDFVDTYAKKRFWLQIDGNIVAKEAISNSYVRFTITYIVNPQ